MLGIPVNASARDLAGNLGKKRLLDIGKEISFPLDLPDLMSPIQRTSKAMDDASAAINLPQDKARHALFWFVKPQDRMGELAYNHLIQGNIDKAIEFFNNSSSWESKHCLSVLYLQKKQYAEALTAIAFVIEQHCADFYSTVADKLFQSDTETMRQQYLKELTSEVNAYSLYDAVVMSATPQSMTEALKHMAVEAPIATIEKAIATAKSVDKENAPAQLAAGKKLMADTKQPLSQLKQVAGSTDSRVSRICDKLAGQIFQCSVNYHNAIDNATDEPVGATVIDECLKLARYAHSIAMGKMTKDRVQNGIGTLEDKKSKLPPAEVEAEVKAITQALKRFVALPDKISYSVTLINDTRQHLQSIKAKLGPTHSFYLQLSSQIVGNALHNCVAEVNAAQKSEVIELNGVNYRVGSDKTKEAVRAAWNCTKMMDGFDMDTQTRSHFDTNKSTLRNMCSQLGISTSFQPRSNTTQASTPRTYTPPRTNLSSGNTGSSSSDGTGLNKGCVYGLIPVLIGGIIGACVNGGEGFLVGCVLGVIMGGYALWDGFKNEHF